MIQARPRLYSSFCIMLRIFNLDLENSGKLEKDLRHTMGEDHWGSSVNCMLQQLESSL